MRSLPEWMDVPFPERGGVGGGRCGQVGKDVDRPLEVVTQVRGGGGGRG